MEAPPPRIVLCANRLGSRREVEEAAVHELVHAYDYLVAGLPLLECQSLAYRCVYNIWYLGTYNKESFLLFFLLLVRKILLRSKVYSLVW